MSGKWSDLGRAMLESSGLTVKVAEQLGMYEVPSAVQLDGAFEARPALVIPYRGINGLPMSAKPKWPLFYRIRYVDKPKSGFAKASDAKEQRYAQPYDTGVCAYFASILDWQDIAKDTEQGLIITEGEKKAAASCLAGYPTIGLGGVWNFRSAKDGLFFLPELEKINWAKRNVYICFDSDYAENPNVCAAINKLGEELAERGALVKVLLLPDVVEGGKTGLDDFFLARDTDEFDELLVTAEPITLSRALWRINEDVLYVEDPGLVVVESTGQKMSPSHFKEHSRWSTLSTPERSVNKDGDVVMKKVQASGPWLRWPMRRSARGITYAPGESRITTDGFYNQWEGWGVEPRKGNVKPFLDLVDFLFADTEKAAKEAFLDWLAYPLQYPGTKIYSSVLIHGVYEGTGKSLIGYTMGRIYGKNWKEITDDDIQGGYTAWAENKQFVMGDEITGSDKREHADMLKRLITQRSITINVKFVPQYDVPDCINYYFTSNHPDAFFMSDTDRRHLVIEVKGEPLPEAFYDAYDKWLWGDGPSHLFHWMLERDISKFSPTRPAMKTKAKERMVVSGKGDLGTWVRELKEAPDQILRVGQMRHTRDLFTSKELLELYKAEHPDNTRVTAVGLGRQLSVAGFIQVADGDPLTGPDGKTARYFAVRNIAQWRKCKSRREMEKNIAMQPTRSGKV